MLFVTNRVLEQGLTPLPAEGSEFRLARSVIFVLENNQAEQSFYCCRRTGPYGYTEIGSANLFDELKSLIADQIGAAIFGDMRIESGHVRVRVRVGLVPRDAGRHGQQLLDRHIVIL